MLSVYGAHGWALSWASPPAHRRTACCMMWPGSPGPWRGAGALLPGGHLHSLLCCPGAVYTRSSAARGPSTLAPLCEPRPGTLCPAAASLSLPPSRAEFGLPHTHPSAFFLLWSRLERSPLPSGESGRRQGLWTRALGDLLCVRAPL